MNPAEFIMLETYDQRSWELNGPATDKMAVVGYFPVTDDGAESCWAAHEIMFMLYGKCRLTFPPNTPQSIQRKFKL